MVFVPYGWEHRGTWAGINYFPAQPDNQSWVVANRALRAAGDATMLLVSGYWWVTKRQENGGGGCNPAFDDSGELAGPAAEMLVKSGPLGGNASIWLEDDYNLSTAKQPWRGLSAAMCHGHPNSTRTLASITAGCRKLGAEVVSFDQEIGGGQQTPCYDPTHAHGPGYGDYMWQGVRSLLKQCHADAAADKQKLGLSTEQTSELSIPYMGTYWSRQFAVVDYPRWGLKGIGLFSFLYHEYVPAMAAALVQGNGGPNGMPKAEPSMRIQAMANGVTRGIALVPFTNDVPLQAANGWQANVSAAFFSFAGVSAAFSEWLVLGETVRPLPVQCGNLSTYYFRRDAKSHNITKQPYTLPAATAGSFKAADGTIGTVIVSVLDGAQVVTVAVAKSSQVSGGGGGGGSSAVLYDGRRTELRRWEVGKVPDQIECQLQPFGVCFLVLHPAHGGSVRLKTDELSVGGTAGAPPPKRPPVLDWLTAADDSHASATASFDVATSTITLENGLVRRVFATSPGFGTLDLAGRGGPGGGPTCIAMTSAMTSAMSTQRVPSPKLNGEIYLLGGLSDPGFAAPPIYNPHTKTWSTPSVNGQHAFVNRTDLRNRLQVKANAWVYHSHRISRPEASIPWTPGRRNSPTYISWPPAGVRLSVQLAPPSGGSGGGGGSGSNSSSRLDGLNVTLVYTRALRWRPDDVKVARSDHHRDPRAQLRVQPLG
jgi:hypothetical protein